jgi:hypothetical protein
MLCIAYDMILFTFVAIPTLILLDEKGGTITTEGLTYILNDQDGEVHVFDIVSWSAICEEA